MKDDKNLGIKRKFCKVVELILIKMLNKNDRDWRLEVTCALDELKNDKDNDVADAAYQSERNALILYKESCEDYQNKVWREEEAQIFEEKLEKKGIQEI